jgi:hypothetical protein
MSEPGTSRCGTCAATLLFLSQTCEPGVTIAARAEMVADAGVQIFGYLSIDKIRGVVVHVRAVVRSICARVARAVFYIPANQFVYSTTLNCSRHSPSQKRNTLTAGRLIRCSVRTNDSNGSGSGRLSPRCLNCERISLRWPTVNIIGAGRALLTPCSDQDCYAILAR